MLSLLFYCCFLVITAGTLVFIFRAVYGFGKRPGGHPAFYVVLIVMIYLGIAWGFGVVYRELYLLDQGAFSFSDVSDPQHPVTFLYFSVAVITSTGFGDIHAKSTVAMAFVTAEMIWGWIMSVMFLSVVASLTIYARSKE